MTAVCRGKWMPEVGEGDDRPWRRREAPLDIREMHTPPPILISPAKEKGLVFLFRSRGGGLFISSKTGSLSWPPLPSSPQKSCIRQCYQGEGRMCSLTRGRTRTTRAGRRYRVSNRRVRSMGSQECQTSHGPSRRRQLSSFSVTLLTDPSVAAAVPAFDPPSLAHCSDT